jgi:hypothetical protein
LTLVDPRNPSTPLLDHSLYMRRDTAYPVSNLFARQPSWAVEARATRLPLPSFDGVASVWAPGATLRAAEILGSRLNASVGYAARSYEGNVAADETHATSRLESRLWQAAAGVGFFPTSDVALSASLAVSRLELMRTVTDPVFATRVQHAAVLYPSLIGDVRFLNIYGPVYAGLAAEVLPARALGIEIDDRRQPLAPAAGSALFGVSF